MDKNELLSRISESAILGHIDADDEGFEGDMLGQPGVMELVKQAVDEKAPVVEIITCLSGAMEEVGKRYEAGEYLVPDMLAGAECVGAAMDFLEPMIAESKVERKGKFLIATVEGDLHDIGKNIVVTLLKGSGYEVVDLGINVPDDQIVDAVREKNPGFVGLSALLTTTMSKMGTVIEALEKAGLRDKVKVFIGGAPTSEDFARKINADYYCEDAFAAVHKLRALAS